MGLFSENNSARIHSVPKQNIMIFQGEVPRSGFIVRKGFVRSYAIDNNGNEQVTGFYGPGDIFPIDWLFEDSTFAFFYYETLTTASVQPIKKSDFSEALQDEASREYILSQMRRDVSTGYVKGLALQQTMARDKIVYFFYYLSLRFGKEVTKNIWNLGLPLTHQLIGSCLGLTRETVAVEVGTLKKNDSLVYRKRQYYVDKKLLVRTVGKEIVETIAAQSAD
jgi:CRP/FNR family transcriptional regulator, anaerobic regulatory protein